MAAHLCILICISHSLCICRHPGGHEIWAATPAGRALGWRPGTLSTLGFKPMLLGLLCLLLGPLGLQQLLLPPQGLQHLQHVLACPASISLRAGQHVLNDYVCACRGLQHVAATQRLVGLHTADADDHPSHSSGMTDKLARGT